jgi:hypothetical protein
MRLMFWGRLNLLLYAGAKSKKGDSEITLKRSCLCKGNLLNNNFLCDGTAKEFFVFFCLLSVCQSFYLAHPVKKIINKL